MQQFWDLINAIVRHKPIDEWLQDEHRSLLSIRLASPGELRDNDDCTPLMWAARFGNVGATALLLEAGVDVEHTGRYGHTPLHLACFQGHTDCARLLLSARASVDLANVDGDTPLYVASDRGHVDCVELLLGAGALVDLAPHHVTPLAIACEHGHIQCAKLLSSYGANRVFVGGTTAEERTAFHGFNALAEWLALSREWSPLHHLELLSPERTRALLRGGADLHLTPSVCNTATPLERARQLAPKSASASLVVRAAGPWSPTTHELFGGAERTRAVRLVHLLYHVYLRRMDRGGWQAVDFARRVLSHLICR
jgi:ankyrin repeat protein